MTKTAKITGEAEMPSFTGSESVSDIVMKLRASLNLLKDGADAEGQCYIYACSGLIDGLANGTIDVLTSDHIHIIAKAAGALQTARNDGRLPNQKNYFDVEAFRFSDRVVKALVDLCSMYGQTINEERRPTHVQRLT
jgi:hypothetical protein